MTAVPTTPQPDVPDAVARLLRRHPTAMLVELEPGHPALVRRDTLLVSGRDTPHVEDAARQWIDHCDSDTECNVSRIRLRADRGVDVAQLARELAGDTYRRRSVTPNHLLRGAPGWWGGPADQAQVPVLVPSPPAAGAPSARRVTVAILDTGIAPHPWFEGEPWYADCDPDDAERLDTTPEDDLLDSQAGHGTFVAGIVRRKAPSAGLVPMRVLGSDGVCDELDLVRALYRLRRWSDRRDRPIDVLNMSLGGYTVDDKPSPLVADALTALGRHTVVVACAGNAASDRLFWPAALKTVVGVGALDSDGSDRAPFSNYGWWVDACAVGERVTSSFVTFDGPLPSTGDHDQDRFSGYAVWSGTSFAAPVVAGTIAAAMASDDVTAPVAADRVLDAATAARSMPDLGVVMPSGAAGP